MQPLRTVTPDEMRSIENRAIAIGVTRYLMMENSGAAVAAAVRGKLSSVKGKKIVVVAGLGNNGGDGMAAARHLAIEEADVQVILLGRPEQIKTVEAMANWRIVSAMKKTLKTWVAADLASWEDASRAVGEADAVIDAIFGTGVKGELGEPYRSAIQAINASKGLVVAVDVPSGLDPLTGSVLGVAVRADLTVSLHRAKAGLAKAREHTGEVLVASIGIPHEAEEGLPHG